MSKWMRYGAVAAAGAVVVLGAWLGPALAFHVLPHHRAGEADRLVAALGLHAGSTVAEIGAGSGWLSIAMAECVGSAGRVYATEIAGDKRAQIAERARDAGVRKVEVREAGERDPELPPGCCDAVFMRNVLHHIDDWPAYASAVAPVLRPGGRVAIIRLRAGRLLPSGRGSRRRAGPCGRGVPPRGVRTDGGAVRLGRPDVPPGVSPDAA